jgi:chaperone required for assembly of F1-ATPase
LRRFWDTAAVEPIEDGFAVLLDGKPLRIPGRHPGGMPLTITAPALADGIAAEWQRAGGVKAGEFTLDDVPLTRLAGTAQDRIAPDPAPVATALAQYAETDLLCYRAEHPVALVVRQAHAWQPWLDWAARTYGARLQATTGIIHLPQDPAALDAIRLAMAGQPVLTLAALGVAVPLLGSAVLGLALADGALDAATAHELSSLDELFQVEAWGEDADAALRRQRVADDIALAERFIRLSR